MQGPRAATDPLRAVPQQRFVLDGEIVIARDGGLDFDSLLIRIHPAAYRVRLTGDGRLRTCLYGEEEVSFRDALRAGEPLAPVYAAALASKPKEHALLQMRVGGLRALSQVGG